MAKEPKTPIPAEWPYVDADGKPIPPERFDNDWPPPDKTTGKDADYIDELIAAGKAEAAKRRESKK